MNLKKILPTKEQLSKAIKEYKKKPYNKGRESQASIDFHSGAYFILKTMIDNAELINPKDKIDISYFEN